MGLFKPAWQSKNIEKARRAVERMTDQQKLKLVVSEAKFPEIQALAVNKIAYYHTQQTFVDIATSNYDVIVCMAALNKLTLENHFSSVAESRSHLEVCMAALNKLTLENYISDVAKSSSHFEVCMAAFNRLKSEKYYYDLAKGAFHVDVCMIALSRISDETLLKTLVLRDAYKLPVCVEAVKKLTDLSALGEIALSGRSKEIRIIAIEKISDQEILAEIALKDKSWEVRLAAVKNLEHQETLAEIVRNDTDKDVELVAIEKITDQSFLVDVILEYDKIYWGYSGEMPVICKKALSQLTDQRLIDKIVRESTQERLKEVALEKLTDQQCLAELARIYSNADDFSTEIFWESIIDKITDQKILTDLSKIQDNLKGRLKIYTQMDNCDKKVIEAINELLYSSNWSERRKGISMMENLLKNDCIAAKMFWKLIAEVAETKHEDIHKGHFDNGGNQSCHGDHNDHTDTGNSITFPPYPFND